MKAKPAPATPDRITQVRIAGLRCIADLKLDLDGLTVLVGDNGAGKSTIIEALELLRHAASSTAIVSDIIQRKHGGFPGLLRHDATELKLAVTIEGSGPKLDYGFELTPRSTSAVVRSEYLRVHTGDASHPLRVALKRDGNNATVFDLRTPATATNAGESVPAADSTLVLSQLGINAQPAIRRVVDALEGIEIHVPFETRPLWQQHDFPNRTGLRYPTQVESVPRLERYAENLANCFYTLHNGDHDTWTRVVDRTRLGLGEDFRAFKFPTAGRGSIELELVFGRAPDHPLRLDALSEGQIAYLAFVAMVELNPKRSVLVFDEPEVHLHPALLARVLFMFEDAAKRTPVVLSTHSDRLLDALEDPAGTVVLCELDERGATRLRRPVRNELDDWLRDYRGLGSIRTEGYEQHVFGEPTATKRGGK